MFKRFLVVSVLSLSLAGCWNPFQTTTNPLSVSNLYESELVFDGSLKTFNELKDLCAKRVLPSSCRTYVVKGQGIIKNAYATDIAARNFIKNNPTLDATNIVQAFTNVVSDFKTTVDNLSTAK